MSLVCVTNLYHLVIDLVEDSWFPGYCWTISYCASCYAHLGWKFTRESSNVSGDESTVSDSDDIFMDVDGSDAHYDEQGDGDGVMSEVVTHCTGDDNGGYEMSTAATHTVAPTTTCSTFW
jgi:hypothetical protein